MKIAISVLLILQVSNGIFLHSIASELDDPEDDNEAFIKKIIEKKIEEKLNDISSAHCVWAGLVCADYCSQCFPGGWCVLDNSGKSTGKCLCNYGWTGAQANFKEDTNNLEWGINRVVANDCNTPCHYTHNVKNMFCISGSTHPSNIIQKCNPKVCEENNRGICINGACQCCKGWTGENAQYANNHYSTDGILFNCNKPCPYLGFGIENPTCKPARLPSPCNPMCNTNNGKCDEITGRCFCCEGWTGDDARFENDGQISVASYCSVYCPYVKNADNNARNFLCVNPDFVKRSFISQINKMDVWKT